MRKVTEQAVKAFLNAVPFNSSNTMVHVMPNVTIMYLHHNPIAYLYNDPTRELLIDHCNWETNTTKERLNGILQTLKIGYIYTKQFKFHLHVDGINKLMTTRKVVFNQDENGRYQVEKLYR